MSKFEITPSRGRRVWAVVFAIAGVSSLVLSERDSSRVNAAILLLAAWEIAFLPSLPFNLTLGEIYQKAQQGWRMSPMSRVISFVTFALVILAIYLQLHGR